MTVKEAVSEKLAALESAKSKILRTGDFLDPSGDSLIYHSLSLMALEGTAGATPNNIGEVMSVVVDKINEYKNYLMTMPKHESKFIFSDRGLYKYSIISESGGMTYPVTWNKIGDGLSFSSLLQNLPMSEYNGFAKRIEFSATPTCRKGGIGAPDIDFEVSLLRINARKDIKEIYHSPGGILSVALDSDTLNGDDIFILGFVPNQPILPTATYFVDLSYALKIVGMDNSVIDKVRTIAGTRIGNIVFDADTSTYGNFMLWDMLSLNSFTVSSTNSNGDSSNIFPRGPGADIGGSVDGNIIEKVSVSGLDIEVSEFKISYRSGVSSAHVAIDDKYTFLDMAKNGISRVVFKNIRPIDIVLEEAINEL